MVRRSERISIEIVMTTAQKILLPLGLPLC